MKSNYSATFKITAVIVGAPLAGARQPKVIPPLALLPLMPFTIYYCLFTILYCLFTIH